MSAPAPLLHHIGVLYDEPESLVEATAPRVAEAVAAGDDVYLSVDRRTARTFREWLGPAADDIEFPSPANWPADLVGGMRAICRPGRRTLVLGQYAASGFDDADRAWIEAAINLVLGDLPLTLVCTCDHGSTPSSLACLHSGHPELLVDGVVVPNPDYRAPLAAEPVSASVWGPPSLRIDFQAPVDLYRLREHITRAAEDVGLDGHLVREAVQATHEAAVLAAGGPDPLALAHAGADLAAPDDPHRTVPCVLEVRADAGSLHCEIVGPRPEVPTGPEAGDEDPLRIVRMFADRALLHDAADTRSVRVLRVPDLSAVSGPSGE